MAKPNTDSNRKWDDIIGFPSNFPFGSSCSFDDFKKQFADELKTMDPSECPWAFIFIMPAGGAQSDILFRADGRFKYEYGLEHLKPNADKPYLFLWIPTDNDAQERFSYPGYINLPVHAQMDEHHELGKNFITEANRGNVFYHIMDLQEYKKRVIPAAAIMHSPHAKVKRYGKGFAYEEAQEHFYDCIKTMNSEVKKLEQRGYKKAASAGKQLGLSLHKAAIEYFKIAHPTVEDFKKFEQACNQAMSKAQPTLNKHWEWPQLFMSVGIIMTTLGLGLAYALHRKSQGGNFLFFEAKLKSNVNRIMNAKEQIETVDKEPLFKGFKPT